MSEWRKKLGWWLAMGHCLLFPVVVTLLVNRPHWPQLLNWLNSEVGAAWAQAVFSAIAIASSAALAIHVDQRAARRLRIDREQGEQRAVDAALSALSYAHKALQKIGTAFTAADLNSQDFNAKEMFIESTNALNVLAYLQAQRHDEPELIAALFEASAALRPLDYALEQYNGSDGMYRRVKSDIINAQIVLCRISEELDEAGFSMSTAEYVS